MEKTQSAESFAIGSLVAVITKKFSQASSDYIIKTALVINQVTTHGFVQIIKLKSENKLRHETYSYALLYLFPIKLVPVIH